MSASKLVRPDLEYKDSFLEALKEFQGEGRNLFINRHTVAENFSDFIQALRSERGFPHKAFQDWVEPVPETILWFVKDDQFIGMVEIRHRLNWHLEKWGGNLNFSIRPSMRGKGFGKKIILKAKPFLNYIGIDRALITVDPQDTVVKATVEGAGAVFEDETPQTHQFPARLRYWLDCT